MNLFFILLLIAMIAAGYYVYQRLLQVEREIRADQRALVPEENSPTLDAGINSPVPASESKLDASAGLALELGIQERSGQAVEENPGLSQPELYAQFPAEDRRELQKLLRELDQSGQLRREKKGSSYRLYPL